jgi:hypothetical protein
VRQNKENARFKVNARKTTLAEKRTAAAVHP